MDKIDMFLYEKQYYDKGVKYIAGVDEVGRGPLAGEVVCASVIMPKDSHIEGVNDSKKVSEKKRNFLYDLILNEAVSVNIFSVDAQKIDEINILEATKLCMREAVLGLNIAPDVVFIDALKLDLPYDTCSIIKGDAKSYTIACASIVAKVFRDRKMLEYAKDYPEYSFEKHKGYGTATHIEAIKKYGLTPIHRRSFTRNFTNEK